jgi:hypothetical protein
MNVLENITRGHGLLINGLISVSLPRDVRCRRALRSSLCREPRLLRREAETGGRA